MALTQAPLPLIRKSPAGRIVNLSSILGSQTLHATPGSPIDDFKVRAYDASKAALNSFTIHLAYELRDTPIKVNSSASGMGEDGYGRGECTDGVGRWGEDERAIGDVGGGWADRRVLSFGREVAVVIGDFPNNGTPFQIQSWHGIKIKEPEM